MSALLLCPCSPVLSVCSSHTDPTFQDSCQMSTYKIEKRESGRSGSDRRIVP